MDGQRRGDVVRWVGVYGNSSMVRGDAENQDPGAPRSTVRDLGPASEGGSTTRQRESN